MQLRRFLLVVGAVAFLSGPATRPVEAQTTAITMDGPFYDWNVGPYSIGYEFNVLSPIMIKALGVFDDPNSWIDPNDPFSGPNGLTETHQIGVWDMFGTLLGSASIAAGGGNLTNYFRFVNVSPFVLAVGAGYRIASTSGYSKYTSTFWASGLLVDPSIQLVRGLSDPGTSLVNPTTTWEGDMFLGPNMQFSAVPEPATMVLLATGLASMMLASLFRRRREANAKL